MSETVGITPGGIVFLDKSHPQVPATIFGSLNSQVLGGMRGQLKSDCVSLA
jgi:hypothetical protein